MIMEDKNQATERRRLGAHGPEIFPIALGCMGMSGMYGEADEKESIATIQAALDQGIQLLDTGDFYGAGHNELLIGKAIQGRRQQAILSVKFGALRGPDGSWIGFDSRPVAVKNFLAYTLKRLKVEYVDIYRPSRLDPQVPIEETIGAISELVHAGYVKQIGLSEVGAETIRRANTVHPISDLQIEYSLVSRNVEAKIFPVVKEFGMSVTAYGVLSRGLLSGSIPSAKADFRASMPRFRGENFQKNKSLIHLLREIASKRNLTPTQLAIAWVMSKDKMIIPTLGARKRSQLHETLGALSVKLSTAEIAEMESQIPPGAVAGSRYDEPQMKMLDSER